MSHKGLLQPGDKIPLFQLPDQHGKIFDIESVLGKKNLVIYFYPKDYTSGCTREACLFRDEYEVFKDHDAEVVGINSEASHKHQAFAQSYRLPFILLSDRERRVEKLFGVKRIYFGFLTGRVSFVVDRQGIVRHVFDSRKDAARHVHEALQVIRSLA